MLKSVKFFWVILLCLCGTILSNERKSSYPYLSGDTWRFFCDWELGQGKKFNPKKVKQGDTIFVEYDSLDRFRQKYLPFISHQFILITPNCENGSDNPLPGKHAGLLKSRKLAAWFVQNLDRAASDKVIPIPIGLANAFWAHGNTNILEHYLRMNAEYPREKEILAYVNFSVGTNAKVRQPCLDYFSSMPWATLAAPKNFSEYLEDLTRTIFVISPPGNGLDCHRTWEALLMGCYPVVKHSTLDPLYKDLPVVCVEDWTEVTQELLEEKYREFQSRAWSREKLFAPYWFNKVHTLQRKLRKSK